VQDLFAAYNAFCDLYPTLIYHRANNINDPNGNPNELGSSYWNGWEQAAYNAYFVGYNSIYDTGSPLHTSEDFPTNINTAYDSIGFNCLNVNRVWGIGNFTGSNGFGYLNWVIPDWYPQQGWLATDTPDYENYQRYFQLNYKDHLSDA
jgi:hypothetical protein